LSPAQNQPPCPPLSIDAELPDWVPPDDVGTRVAACGVRFDAVSVAEVIGAVALELLGACSGPVIADGRDLVLFWLVRPGGAEGWGLPVTVYGSGCYLPVPSVSPRGTRSVRWLTPPVGDCLTDPKALRDALVAAAPVLGGPARGAVR
jgi:hypothetical protein